MNRGLRRAFGTAFLAFILAPVLQAQPTASPADPLYQQALGAYLSGDYDKALTFAAQALDKDPTHSKTRNLIAILASEKDQEGKTVIWIGGKAVPAPEIPREVAPVKQDPGLREDLDNLKGRLERYYHSLLGRGDRTEGKIRVVQELVKENSEAQYGEVRASQVALYRKLEEVEKGQDLRLLYLLCGASLLLSTIALMRKAPKG